MTPVWHFCGHQGLKIKIDNIGQGIQEWTKQTFWKTAFKKFEVMAVFHKFYLVDSWIPWPIFNSKRRMKQPLNSSYIHVKKYSEVNYLGCVSFKPFSTNFPILYPWKHQKTGSISIWQRILWFLNLSARQIQVKW